ncbi:hypothetical protein [Deinococcus yavapaiensis]|uniref:Uncharacterized protein n=1 Tax=Deinococcus yavapaiensis KR-236 TaxID=694435 RepID=A0A318SGJ4_9DEIO|nr:hypothetical protein [Deinococcus yavapaiensis]PYE56524.1 hypothetical protein DES52_101328 [Deinococcus yavapaiensis KR-236]
MRHPALLLSLALLSSTAFAWVPKLDDKTAKTVVDSAYDRLDDPVNTLLTVDLGVKDGKFASDGAVRALTGGESCVQNWLANPSDFAKFGSRPTTIVMTGQADDVFLAAQSARDEFRNFTSKDALTLPNRLADGQLRVYVTMSGLASQRQRDAYNVALRLPDGKIVRAARRAFTNDWKQTGDRWGGTMLYTFDALGAGVNPTGKLDLVIKTEADSDCAFVVTADLSKFY